MKVSFSLADCTVIAAITFSAPTFVATVVFNDTLDISKPSVEPFPARDGVELNF